MNCDIRDFILVHGKILREKTFVEEPEEAGDFRAPSMAPGLGIGGKRTKQSTIALGGGQRKAKGKRDHGLGSFRI